MNDFIEKNIGVMMVLILVAVSFGGIVEIIPLMSQKVVQEPIDGLKPLTPVQLEGRDIYIREGCNVCHSQMIRPLRAEVERYGHYTVAGELVYNHPFLFGSKRTGPDLARVGAYTVTSGTERICLIRGPWCLSQICRLFPGCLKTKLMAALHPGN